MRLLVCKKSITITPENEAETYYLGHIVNILEKDNVVFKEDRQWVTESLTLPLIKKDKAHD